MFVGPDNGLPDGMVNLLNPLTTDGPSGSNTAQRDRMTRWFLPPLTKILEADQSLISIGEAAFMDNYPSIHLTVCHGIHDLVKTQFNQLPGSRCIHTKKHVCSGETSGNSHFCISKVCHIKTGPCHQKWTASPTKGWTGWENAIVIQYMTQGMKGEFRDIKPLFQGPGVQGLHILKEWGRKLHSRQLHLVVGQAIKDIGVIGTGGITDGKLYYHASINPLRSSAAAFPACSHASLIFQRSQSLSSTKLEIVRISRRGNPYASQILATAAPSIFSQRASYCLASMVPRLAVALTPQTVTNFPSFTDRPFSARRVLACSSRKVSKR